jgi:hypothetical protein
MSEGRRDVDHKPTDYESHFTVSVEKHVDYRLRHRGVARLLEALANWGWTGWAAACAAAGFAVGALVAQTSKRAPSRASVQHAAERYRQTYGGKALEVIGDHTFAARFAPTHEHYRFLLQVTEELQRGV